MVEDFAGWYQRRFGPTRYADQDLIAVEQSGQITSDDLNRVLRLLQQAPLERDLLAEWFGAFITRPQRGPADTEEFEGSYQEFLDDFADCQHWRRHEGIRVAFWAGERLQLFVDGDQIEHELSQDQLEFLTSTREISFDQVSNQDELTKLLYSFTQRGWGYLLLEDNDNG